VLERYGIENYFSQAACESVLGLDLSSVFPLPPFERVQIPNWNKNRNAAIATTMELEDLRGTDLREFLDIVGARGAL